MIKRGLSDATFRQESGFPRVSILVGITAGHAGDRGSTPDEDLFSCRGKYLINNAGCKLQFN